MKNMEDNYDAMVEALNTEYNPTEDERCELRRGLEEWINMNINSHLLNLQSVKLILIPLYFFEHYTLYVINFEKQKVQYLDNLKFEVDESLKVNELLVSRFSKSLVRELSIVLEELNHTSAKDITGYELENVKQHCDNKGNDCGVFVMKNLELFNGGEKFTCKELANFYKRIMIRAEICATLALADINQVRDELLAKVDDFNNNKEDLSKHVKLKLQEIKIAEQQRQKELMKKKKEEEAMKKKAAADKKKKDAEAKKNKRDEVKNTENQVVEKKDKPIAEKKKNDDVEKQAVGKKDKPIAEKKKNDVVEKQAVGKKDKPIAEKKKNDVAEKDKKKVAEQKDQGKTRNSKKK